jgi:glutamine amidotransferase
MPKICIIDYKTGGNIFSVNNSLEYIGTKPIITSDPDEILKSDKIIFPGVGSFQVAAEQINKLGISDALKKARDKKIPILGICVGMQIMFEAGTEGTRTEGLGFFKGTVEEFKSTELKIPHMGWNEVDFTSSQKNPLCQGLKAKENFYFVHSYRVAASTDQKAQIATCSYAGDFIAHIYDGATTWGSQFHIEKSGEAGLQMLRNFVSL